MGHFLLTIVILDKDNLTTRSILFNSFDEAYAYVQKDVEYYNAIIEEKEWVLRSKR